MPIKNRDVHVRNKETLGRDLMGVDLSFVCCDALKVCLSFIVPVAPAVLHSSRTFI